MREIALFSGEIYTAGTNFTRPLVMTVATNLNSGQRWAAKTRESSLVSSNGSPEESGIEDGQLAGGSAHDCKVGFPFISADFSQTFLLRHHYWIIGLARVCFFVNHHNI